MGQQIDGHRPSGGHADHMNFAFSSQQAATPVQVAADRVTADGQK